MGKGRMRQFVANTICQLSVMVASAATRWFDLSKINIEENAELDFSENDISLLATVANAIAITGPVVAGYMSDKIGRKYVIMSVGPLFLAGWAAVLSSSSMYALILVRIFHGLTAGVVFTVTPIYTAEIAEPKLRGRLSGTYQLMEYLGIIYSFCFGSILEYNMIFYSCLPLPIMFTIIWMFMPESPYYLMMTKREEEAKKVLRCFRDEEDIAEEFQIIQSAMNEELSTRNYWKILLFDKTERKAFVIVQIVCITKYLTGTTVIEDYVFDTFTRSEHSLSLEVISLLVAAVLTVISVAVAFLSDWVGRKPLLLVSCFGSFVGHFLTGGYFYLRNKTNLDPSYYSWALNIGLFMYCFFLDIGLGPLLQTLQSEVFGDITRGIAAGITDGFAAFLSLMAETWYTPVNEAFRICINFWFYALVGLFGGVLLSLFMNETAGKRIGQMTKKVIDRGINEGGRYQQVDFREFSRV